MALSISGTANSANNAVSLTGVQNGDVVIFVAGGGLSGATSTTVSGGGLTWTREAHETDPAGSRVVELFWAVANATGTLAISASNASIAYTGAAAISISGANTTTPFDTNVSLPATNNANATGTSTVSGVSTTNANTVLIGAGVASGSGPAVAGSGYTLVWGSSGGPIAAAEYQIVSSAQSSATVSLNLNATAAWGMLVTAVQAAGGGGGFTASLSEAASAADTVSDVLGISASISESGTATDTVSDVFGRSVSVSEAGTATDTTNATPPGSFTGTITEAASATDTATVATFGRSVSVSEAGTAIDAPADVFGQSVSVSEAGTATDTTNATSGSLTASITEVANAVDTARSTSPAPPFVAVPQVIYADVATALAVQRQQNLLNGMPGAQAAALYYVALYNLQTQFINNAPSPPTLVGPFNANRVATYLAILTAVGNGAQIGLPPTPPPSEFMQYGYAYSGKIGPSTYVWAIPPSGY